MKKHLILLSILVLSACGQPPSTAERFISSQKAASGDAGKATTETNGSPGSTTGTSVEPAADKPKTGTASEDSIVKNESGKDVPVKTLPGSADTTAPLGKISDLKVLVFSKTGGFRHGDSIEEGIKSMKALSAKYGFMMEATEDAAAIRKDNLAKFNVVFFLNTTGEILNDEQKKDFQEYMENGGGYVGTHSASDTLYNWPFYETIVGAWFGGHSGVESAKVKVENKNHPSTSFLSDIWTRADEWYNYRKNPRMNVTVLMTLDETSYAGGRSNNDHPITWCKEVGKGRSWYTGFGHTRETFSDPQMLRMLLNAQLWAAKINATVAD